MRKNLLFIQIPVSYFIFSFISIGTSGQSSNSPSCNVNNKLPVVTITSPVTGTSFNAGATITITAAASDSDGTVSKVTFFEHGNKLGEDSNAPYTYTRPYVEGGNYSLTATVTDNLGATTCSGIVLINLTTCTGSGSISAEGFSNTKGLIVGDVMNNPAFPDRPDVLESLSAFEYGPNLGDQYAARVRGYICAPQTGYYNFYISGDDQVGLWLSTDDNPANKQLIAYAESWTEPMQWNKFAKQKSAPVMLVKGGRYYIETLHKEYVGPDHLGVAWTLPGGQFEAPIQGKYLSPWVSTATAQPHRIGNFNQVMITTIGVNKPLQVIAAQNPARNYFSISINSSDNNLLSIIVTDVAGRIMETKEGIAANGTIQFGAKLGAGIYFIEVRQGSQIQKLKLVKQ
ncbi:Ig-like domain-containing protein [Ferruginibacter paludis]|uniref:Ig-like domain-containing protein n=1 Tax=Ferruginibacter paludis TaxID=1310417 RepID=UPI0025B2ACAE|nr:Ig-like domain-containing protein [Ferruginibacter paludis]MDN3656760.1 Ig-like domain-containing protein [Ferruginibacter paludis]